MARVFIVVVLAGLILTSINIVVWNQFILFPSDGAQASSSCDCSVEHSIADSAPTVATIAVSLTLSSPTSQKVATNEASVRLSSPSTHKLSVVVPFRNRFEEMLEFVPHMHSFLNRQNISHEMWIINQVDNHRFNRAALLNIGFLLSRNECDYLVMHDIDLLPLNNDLRYEYPATGPLHISAPWLHPLYHYKTFVGGILIMSRIQYEQVDGLSNLFWGWGREDDELYTRMREKKMVVQYPKNITTGYKTFKHNHDKAKRPRDQKQYKNQWNMSRRIDRQTGFSNLKFEMVSSVAMSIAGAKFNFVSVKVHCDYKITPFCDNPS